MDYNANKKEGNINAVKKFLDKIQIKWSKSF